MLKKDCRYECKVCEKFYSSSNSLWNHNKKFHSENNTKKSTSGQPKATSGQLYKIKKYNCKYCNKERKTQRSVNAHQPLCKLNPNAKPIKQKTEAYYAAIAKRKHSNQYTKARDEGRPAPILSNETKNKISIAMSKRNKERFSDPLERQKHADAMLEAVRKHPDSYTKNNVCGRVKIVEYNGIKLKGKWELKVAKWLDGQNIYDRIRSEKAPLTEFTISGAGKEVTLDEARADFAAAVGSLAHTLFSRTYGPLVGNVTKTSVETVLKSAEESLHRAKGDISLLAEELTARIFPEKKK